MPLLKMCFGRCGAHRSGLAYRSLSKTVSEVHTVIQQAVRIATIFHTTGVRTKELEDIGRLHGLTVKHLPEYFEVRWPDTTTSSHAVC
jgi:hypothetical protein